MISVVIPAYNEEEHIGRCLESLARQKTKREFEVIVVDNNSTDKTSKAARAYAKKLDLTVLLERRQGRGAARRAGCKAAKGDILFCTDADSEVPARWIEALASALEKDEKAVAVTSPTKITDCARSTNAVFNKLVPVMMETYKQTTGSYWLNGASFAIKKSAYLSVGGFNANSDAFEDNELSMKVSKMGEIRFVKNIAVITSGRRFQQGLFRGLYDYAKSYTNKFIMKRENALLSNRR